MTGPFHVIPDPSSSTGGIQAAIDELPDTGGIVQLAPGEYLLQRSIRFRGDNITLRGAGAATRLRLPLEAQARLLAPAAEGDTRLQVTSTAGLTVGRQLSVAEREWYGWGEVSDLPLVVGIDGDQVELNQPLGKAYAIGAAVTTVVPGIHATGCENLTVEDLTLDGGCDVGETVRQSYDYATGGRVPEGDLGPFCSFTCAAIHAEGCRHLRLRGLRVVDWPSDGLSVQGAQGATIEACLVSGCRGAGIHPGMKSRHVIISGCDARANAWDGIYLCHNVSFGTITGNVLSGNGQFGIGGIGWSDDAATSDQGNSLTGNVCDSNGWAGIQVIKGCRNVISANVCRNNSQAEPGAWPGILLEGARQLVVSGNLCYCDTAQNDASQSWGILERDSWDGATVSDGNLITGNHCADNLEGAVHTSGAGTVARDNLG